MTITNQSEIIKMAENLAYRLKHEKARYEGDGDPGCNGHCLRCEADKLVKTISHAFTIIGWD